MICRLKADCPSETRSKVAIGDRILAVNGKSIRGYSRCDVQNLLAALKKKGGSVVFRISKPHMLSSSTPQRPHASIRRSERSLSNGLESTHSDSFVAVEQIEMPLFSRSATRGGAGDSLDSFTSLVSHADVDDELAAAAIATPWLIRWHDAIQTVEIAKEKYRKKIGLTYKFKSKVCIHLSHSFADFFIMFDLEYFGRAHLCLIS